MKRNKKRLVSGDIIEIYLSPYINKYAYVKYINLKKIIENPSYPDLFKIFDLIEDQPMKSFEKICNSRMLCNSVFLSGSKAILQFGNYVGNSPISIEESKIPDVKIGYPLFLEDHSLIESWQYLEGGNPSKAHDTSYTKVNHLNFTGAFDAQKIGFRIALEYYKLLGEDIRQVCEFDWLEKEIYKNFIDLPLYKNIPDKYKQKAIT